MSSGKIFKNYIPEIFYLNFYRKKPNAVTVNITDKCNQSCIYCELGKNIESTRKGQLLINDIKWIIDQMYMENIRRLALCGGEPFLYDGIIEIIEYAGKKNVNCSVTSNGMNIYDLTDEELEVLKRNNTQINISIDSFQESIHNLTRGNALALKNALASIKRLKEKCIPVTLLCVISKYNFQDLFSYFKKAYETGIRQVLFQPVISYSNYPDREKLDRKAALNVTPEDTEVLLTQLRSILSFEKKHRISTNAYRIMPWITHYIKATPARDGNWFFSKILKKFYCRDIYAIIDISYDGGIQPCGLSLATVSINENRHLGLLQLWSDATEKIKDDVKNGNLPLCCNGCCHHFSRNMIASVIKYPVKNRISLTLLIVIISRFLSIIVKQLIVYK